MDAGSIASIIVATIALIGAYASQRAASKAAQKSEELKSDTHVTTAQIEGRVDMERDAYIRARQFDLETIARQAKEIKELRDRVEELEAEVDQLKKERYDERRRQYDTQHHRPPGSSSGGTSGDSGFGPAAKDQ